MVEKEANGLKRYLVAVAVSVTTALVLQSGTLVWWASSINTRVNYCERDLAKVCDRVHDLEKHRP